MSDRTFIAYTNDPEEVDRWLDAGPQLCMVLKEDLPATALYNIVETVFVYAVDIHGTERYVALCGAHKIKGGFKRNPEKTEKAFGRDVTEQIHDAPIEIEGIPYIPFSEDSDPLVINKMREVFDIQEIEYLLKPRTAILGHYYNKPTESVSEGKVVSQVPPIYHHHHHNN